MKTIAFFVELSEMAVMQDNFSMKQYQQLEYSIVMFMIVRCNDSCIDILLSMFCGVDFALHVIYSPVDPHSWP